MSGSSQGCSKDELRTRFPEVFQMQDLSSIQERSNSSQCEEPPFELMHVNDFSQEQLKAESQYFQLHGELTHLSVCHAIQGGPLDFPKAVTKSVGGIVQKWDHCFQKVEEAHEALKSFTRSPSDDEVFAKLTDQESVHTDNDDDGEDLIDDLYYSTISESASKVFIHSYGMIKKLLANGDGFSLLRVYGALALVRNKLWYYNMRLVIPDLEKPFDEQYDDFTQLMESVSEQLMEHFSSTIATTILHDPESQDWTNERPFYEGEKVSHCIQMWWYYLQGLKSDLWSTLPSKVGQKILSGVFNESLAILTTRYFTVVPSASRLDQYQGDIIAILTIASEIITFFATNMDDVTRAGFNNPHSLDIHAKCNQLLSILAIKASPLAQFSKVAKSWEKSNPKRKATKSPADSKARWLHLIRPELFPPNPDEGAAEFQVPLLTKLVANQSEPSWSLLIQAVMGRKCSVAKLIMLHFGAFVPGTVPGGEILEQVPNFNCTGYGCSSQCVGTADIRWPQAVGSATIQVCLEGSRSSKILLSIFEPLLAKLSPHSWEAWDKGNMWNPRKPVWIQALIQLLNPFMVPMVQDILGQMNVGKVWTMAQVQPTLKETLAFVQDVVPILPPALLYLCKHLDQLVPPAVKPLCKSTITHLLICSLYGTIEGLQPWLKRKKFPREKMNFFIAFNEALCNLGNSVELIQIQSSVDNVLTEIRDSRVHDPVFDATPNEFNGILAESLANEILSSPEGGQSLKSLYRFFCYNADWVQSALKVQSVSAFQEGAIPVLIKPWGSEMFPPQNPYEMMNQIGQQITFEKIIKATPPWEAILKHVFLYSNPMVNLQLIQRRPEFMNTSMVDQQRLILDMAEEMLPFGKVP
eukprot:maker-scaffold72_size415059-snap-gene-2.24 protein:Tk08675 transcript:maker-scaffold72_size415059-snap-gene-2.24-mRNA-1 annotation:"hypothetical protein L798_07241"